MYKLRYAKTALAVAAALSGSIAYAVDDGAPKKRSSFNVTTKKIDNGSDQSSKLLNFTTKAVEVMKTDNSKKYMKDESLLNVSTFPMRLLNTLSKTPWKPHPSRPIQQKDLACYYDVPSYREPKPYDVNTTPVNVEADDVEGKLLYNNQEILEYKGNVVISQGDKQITADEAQYISISKTIKTIGSTVFNAPEYTVTTTDGAEHNLEKKTIVLDNSKYFLNGSVYNGTAQRFEHDGEKGTKVLKDATLSACPISKQSWHIASSSIEIDKDSSFGSSWNDVLYLGKVPVFYTPYANFPITNKRKSGLLPIELGYNSSEGLSYELPIYLNLATNYDATFTPSHDAKRGDYYKLEIRDMPFKNLSGHIQGTVYTNDKVYNKSREAENKPAVKRFFLNIQQKLSLLMGDLNFKLDYSKVRNDDYTYLSDISQKNVAITDSSLVQSLKGDFNQTNYDISAEVRRYQNMYSVNNNEYYYHPFALEPRVTGSTYDTLGPFAFRLDTELTNFSLDKMKDDRTLHFIRSHAEPSVKYHVYDGYGTSFELGARYFLTHYSQDDLDGISDSYKTRLGYTGNDTSITRTLYHIEAKAKTTLERKVIDMRHTQTLEPEIRYNYIPYKDQNNIALYDTTSRYDDYYTLFSYRKYAGIDRIANVNAVTAGFTSRILDPHDKEKLRFSIAQAYNFEDNKVKLYQTDTLRNDPKSPIEASLDAQPIEQLRFHLAAQYDPNKSELKNYSSTIKFTSADNITIGTSYRYYKQGNYHVKTLEPMDLKQLGFDFNIPLSHDYKVFGAFYKDLEQNYNIDRKLGIKYEDCCFAISLLYESYMNIDWQNYNHIQEKFFGIQFELKGLYSIKAKGISDPNGTSTHYLPSLDLTSLNQ